MCLSVIRKKQQRLLVGEGSKRRGDISPGHSGAHHQPQNSEHKSYTSITRPVTPLTHWGSGEDSEDNRPSGQVNRDEHLFEQQKNAYLNNRRTLI